MTTIDTFTIEATDLAATTEFHAAGLPPDLPVRLRESDAPTSGFRGFTISLLVDQPADARLLLDRMTGAGGTTLKPATKSMWGFGGVVQAPDGTIWKAACQAKKDSGPATGKVNQIVVLLGVEDVKATKAFYLDHGLEVASSYGGKYVEFDSGPVTLALNKRKALAKDAGVPPEGDGSHRLVLHSDAGAFTDPDGFAWEDN